MVNLQCKLYFQPVNYNILLFEKSRAYLHARVQTNSILPLTLILTLTQAVTLAPTLTLILTQTQNLNSN